jgi:hypothetical protein
LCHTRYWNNAQPAGHCLIKKKAQKSLSITTSHTSRALLRKLLEREEEIYEIKHMIEDYSNMSFSPLLSNHQVSQHHRFSGPQ